MKKLLSVLILAVGFLQVLCPPSEAALSYQTSGTKYGANEHFSAYITATGNDTTDPVNGKVIDNRDGRVKYLSAQVNVTASTGTSPTLNLLLQGSDDGSNWRTLRTSQADTAGTTAAISTGATSISSATTFGLSTAPVGLQGGFPAFLRWQVDVGGTDTPGWTGTVSASVYRGQ